MPTSETTLRPERTTNRLVLWLIGFIVLLCIGGASLFAVSYSLYAAERAARQASDRVAVEERRRFECTYENRVHDSIQGIIDLVTTASPTDGLDDQRRAIVEQQNVQRAAFKTLAAPLIDKLSCPVG